MDVPDQPDDGDACPSSEPTSGERLLYALGQLYLRWHHGQTDLEPAGCDVLRLARVFGVARDIELVCDGPLGRSYHLPGEVLVVDDREQFPWQLMDLDTWALLQELAELDLGL